MFLVFIFKRLKKKNSYSRMQNMREIIGREHYSKHASINHQECNHILIPLTMDQTYSLWSQTSHTQTKNRNCYISVNLERTDWHPAYQSTMCSWNIGKLTQHRSNHSNTCLKQNITPKNSPLLSTSFYCKICFCHFSVKISFITAINTASHIMIQEKNLFSSIHLFALPVLCYCVKGKSLKKLQNQNRLS